MVKYEIIRYGKIFNPKNVKKGRKKKKEKN